MAVFITDKYINENQEKSTVNNYLNDVKFWDKDVESVFKEKGLPLYDASLQIKAEAQALAKWIAENKIRSYLEIGVWTGKLISGLHKEFNFDKLAACDTRSATQFGFNIDVPSKTDFFHGNCMSPIYANWRSKLGEIDLVLIDADHSYETTLHSININSEFKSKYIAVCGIANNRVASEEEGRGINGVTNIWKEVKAEKTELIFPHSEIGLDHSTIGIGIVKL